MHKGIIAFTLEISSVFIIGAKPEDFKSEPTEPEKFCVMRENETVGDLSPFYAVKNC